MSETNEMTLSLVYTVTRNHSHLNEAFLSSLVLVVPTLPLTTRWNQQGVTVLEGLNWPHGLAVDEDDGTVYVADRHNHRIVATTPGSNDTNGRVVAGGNGKGSEIGRAHV